MFHVFFKVLQQYTSTLLNRNDYRTWISSKARIRESVLLLLQPRGAENALNKAVGLITRGTSGATEGRLESEINGGDQISGDRDTGLEHWQRTAGSLSLSSHLGCENDGLKKTGAKECFLKLVQQNFSALLS
jgi:hypothetical protein